MIAAALTFKLAVSGFPLAALRVHRAKQTCAFRCIGDDWAWAQ